MQYSCQWIFQFVMFYTKKEAQKIAKSFKDIDKIIDDMKTAMVFIAKSMAKNRDILNELLEHLGLEYYEESITKKGFRKKSKKR